MKIKKICIYDQTCQKYFMFIKDFPAVCAQGDTKEEANNKIIDHFNKYFEYMRNKNFEFSEIEQKCL